MKRKITMLTLCAVLVALCVSVQAEQAAKQIARLGFLYASVTPVTGGGLAELKAGLREMGYVEGRNITFEHRHAEGKADRLSALAAELVRLKVDVILTGGSTATQAAKQATHTIHIVMASADVPIQNGFIASLRTR